ncbi:MAG: hypothetical protein IPP72_09895 [Chitinophagaceae bacterium]|nr:hypothetical protein [Chitinophagaceae bacterium]
MQSVEQYSGVQGACFFNEGCLNLNEPFFETWLSKLCKEAVPRCQPFSVAGFILIAAAVRKVHYGLFGFYHASF